jgi:hypothetical protein
MARPAAGGKAIIEASVAQYLRKVRRLTPRRTSVSIKGPCMMLASRSTTPDQNLLTINQP